MMKDLNKIRVEIDKIDNELIALFEKRMHLVKEVVDYKIINNLPIFHPEREKEVIIKNCNLIRDKNLKVYGHSFIQDLMDISKSYQTSFINKSNNFTLHEPELKPKLVGYQGIPGAFSHQALLEFFEESSNKAYGTFEEVCKAVKNNEIVYGVLPLENSSTGAITDNYDLVRDYELAIVGQITLKISQNLLVVPGTKIENLQEVVSHTQGLLQTQAFLSKYPKIKQTPVLNTALAAKYVATCNSKNIGAIASKNAAKIYGLELLVEDINTANQNETRFIIVGKNLEKRQDANCVSIVFTLKHQAGTLYQVLKAIKDQGISMSRIESRPMINENWHYYFYIDFEGNLQAPNVQVALENIKNICLDFKVIGNYFQI